MFREKYSLRRERKSLMLRLHVTSEYPYLVPHSYALTTIQLNQFTILLSVALNQLKHSYTQRVKATRSFLTLPLSITIN